MSQTAPARTRASRSLGANTIGLVVAMAAIVVIAAIVGTFVYQSASSSAPSFGEITGGAFGDGTVAEDDGVLHAGVTVFDDRYPGITNLQPSLLHALRQAATDAAHQGVKVYINSGWRSRNYQDQLFRQAVSNYGSSDQAARWVDPPGMSAHESGDAVDIGPPDAAAWLSANGARYGLCQIYQNEPWHYELRPEAIARGCPRMYPDPTYDPRMRQGPGGSA